MSFQHLLITCFLDSSDDRIGLYSPYGSDLAAKSNSANQQLHLPRRIWQIPKYIKLQFFMRVWKNAIIMRMLESTHLPCFLQTSAQSSKWILPNVADDTRKLCFQCMSVPCMTLAFKGDQHGDPTMISMLRQQILARKWQEIVFSCINTKTYHHC